MDKNVVTYNNFVKENDKKFCRKNQVFYKRQHTIDFLFDFSYRDFLGNFECLLMFGQLYKINGFLRREKGFTKKDEVFKYYMEIFGYSFRGDRIMHKYINELRFIISFYD